MTDGVNASGRALPGGSFTRSHVGYVAVFPVRSSGHNQNRHFKNMLALVSRTAAKTLIRTLHSKRRVLMTGLNQLSLVLVDSDQGEPHAEVLFSEIHGVGSFPTPLAHSAAHLLWLPWLMWVPADGTRVMERGRRMALLSQLALRSEVTLAVSCFERCLAAVSWGGHQRGSVASLSKTPGAPGPC